MIKFVRFWIFNFLCRLEKVYGGKVFAGLRIPDADSASPQTIDLVLVTKRYFSSIQFLQLLFCSCFHVLLIHNVVEIKELQLLQNGTTLTFKLNFNTLM